MKTVYLTIDDCPSEDFRNKVDFLISKEIPAILFCEGWRMERHTEDVVYAIKKGFVIGNHSWSHPHFGDISIAKAKEEIKKTDDLINELYSKANVERKLKVFRFPYLGNGDNSEYGKCDWNNGKVVAIQNILKSLGYKRPYFKNINHKHHIASGFTKCVNVDCTYDSMDWTVGNNSYIFGIKNLDDLLKRIDENFSEEEGGLNSNNSNDIVMMHDDFRIKEMFKPIINRLLAKGLKFGKIE